MCSLKSCKDDKTLAFSRKNLIQIKFKKVLIQEQNLRKFVLLFKKVIFLSKS